MTPGDVPPDSRWPVVLAEVDALVRADRREAAAALLAPLLANLDPGTCPPDLEIIDIATRYAETAELDGSGHTVPWARYAHQAALTACRPEHERTLRAAEALADIHDNQNEHRLAVPLRRQVLRARTTLEGTGAGATVQAAMRLAESLHNAGDCDEAVIVLHAFDTDLSQRHGKRDLQALEVRYYRSVLLRRCGRVAHALHCWNGVSAHLPPPDDPRGEALRVRCLQWRYAHGNEPHEPVCAYQQPPPAPNAIPPPTVRAVTRHLRDGHQQDADVPTGAPPASPLTAQRPVHGAFVAKAASR